jgi:hypothetical protein
MKMAVEMEAYQQAALYYTQSKSILDRHKHIPSFEALNEKCRIYIIQIVEKLQDSMKDINVRSPLLSSIF